MKKDKLYEYRVDNQEHYRNNNQRYFTTYLNPRIIHHLLHGKPVLWVGSQEASNQFLGW